MQRKEIFERENILARLKRETEQAHRETERLMPFDEERFSMNDYLELLVKFYKFYRHFEPGLITAMAARKIAFDYRERLKTPKLIADLQSLGMNEKAIGVISADENDLIFDSGEKIFGALYVVEGSTLGGQIIARHLKARFGLNETGGAAFFAGYAAQTGLMWNEFRAAITDFAASDSNHDEIIGAAQKTFEIFGRAIAS